MDVSYLERRFAFDTFPAHFNPRSPGGDYSSTKFNSMKPGYIVPKKEITNEIK
jgi:hypothetical protein